ncbi:uncharacterized protein LOC107004257 [Solanum pennellii]|uniref:Uncharacterized protein LOC107004257 n=1 Tax=Solanum pennellii TaxID=28526 RepID=A0ABM1FJW7_SOLPN|nr:uncharacterized protein LOC107004257 [Solanum pennellii]
MFRHLPPNRQIIHLSPITQSSVPPRNDMNNYPHPPQSPNPPLVFATQPIHPSHQPQSWVEMSLQGQAIIFSMDINGMETLVILQNQNFLAQLISEGMKVAMDFFVNQLWAANVLDPLAPAVTPAFIQTMQTLWNLPHHLSPYPNLSNLGQTPFFTPQELIHNNPLIFPWMPVQTPQPTFPIPVPGSQSTQIPLDPEVARAPSLGRISSFTEISNFKSAALMIFPKEEDKKYIHNCPPNLTKFSFDLRPAINSALAKYAVVLSPTLRIFPNHMSGNVDVPPFFCSPMTQPTSIIVWNTRGVNNDNFKRNFKELIRSHNPCMVALLETKLCNHHSMVSEYGFDDYWENPAQGRSGGIVLLWHSNIITVTRKRQTPHELHAMIQINVEEVGESSGPP